MVVEESMFASTELDSSLSLMATELWTRRAALTIPRPHARLPGVVWRRHTPVLSTAEVAGVMLVVAMAAQWGHLALRPLLAWQSVGRSAPIAEPARQ